jgi:hypothetical protein
MTHEERGRPLCSPEELLRAWRTAYRHAVDRLPDAEVAWERDFWRAGGLETLAAIGDDLLRERREAGAAIPGGADAAALARLFLHVDRAPVLRLVEDEALPLVEAIRLNFWAGLREVRR